MAWLSGYTTRRKLTIDQTKVDANLTDFPTLVKLTASNFDFAKANADGFDIRFTDSDGTTLLKYERERHDSVNSLAEYWVKVPAVSGTVDTEFYIYYRTTITADGADPIAVWDSNYKGVYHLKDDPNTSTVQDSTSNNHDGTKRAAGSPAQIDAKIAKGQDCNGTNDYINIGNSSDFNFTTGITLSVWAKHDNSTTDYIVAKKINPNASYSILAGAGVGRPAFEVYISGVSKQAMGPTTMGTTNFRHLVGTFNGSKVKVYMDGAEVDSINSVGSIDITTEDVRIGWGWADSQCWNGIVDEVRLSNIARGPEWIKTSYNSENDTLLTYGSEEVLSSVTVTFTERGRIKMVGVTDKETTRSRIKTTGLTKKETLKGRIKISQTTRNQTIRGKIKGLGTIRKETSRGRIKESGITKTETLKAKIKGLGILVTETSRGKIKASTSKTSSMRAKIIKQRGLRARINRINVSLADIRATIKGLGITKLLDILARIKSVNSKTLQARGFIVDIGKTYLYAPPTGSYSNIPVAFKWYIPSNRWGKDMSFEIQIDKTNDTFNDLEADVFSFSNPGMEYFDGANWNSISSTGVPSTYSGNLARFITNLTNGLKYWRVRAFVG